MLHYPAYDGQSDLCKLLLERQADPNAKDPSGQTPLFFARWPHVCEVLIEFKADICELNLRKQSAVHNAAHAGFDDVLLWYATKASRALLGMRDDQGKTAADYAGSSGVRHEVLNKFQEATAGNHTVFKRGGVQQMAASFRTPAYVPGGNTLEAQRASARATRPMADQEARASTMQASRQGGPGRRSSTSFRDDLPSAAQRSPEVRAKEFDALQKHMQSLNNGAAARPSSAVGIRHSVRASTARV